MVRVEYDTETTVRLPLKWEGSLPCLVPRDCRVPPDHSIFETSDRTLRGRPRVQFSERAFRGPDDHWDHLFSQAKRVISAGC